MVEKSNESGQNSVVDPESSQLLAQQNQNIASIQEEISKHEEELKKMNAALRDGADLEESKSIALTTLNFRCATDKDEEEGEIAGS